MSLFSTAEFWLSVSFVIFLLLFSKKIYVAVSKFLEDKINEIENVIEESDASHIEASNLLNTKRQDLTNIQSGNSEFLAKSTKNYETSLQNSMQELDEKIAFAKKQKKALLKQYEENFYKEVSQATLESAFNVAKNASVKSLSKEQHLKLINNSVEKLSAIMQKRKKH